MLLREVTPVHGEMGVYLVESRSRPAIQHRVDVLAYNGNGACGCEHFEIRVRGTLERGAKPAIHLECRHLAVARKVFGVEMAMAYARVKKEERKRELETKAETKGAVAHGLLQRSEQRSYAQETARNKILPDG